MQLSIVIPCYKSSAILPTLVRDIGAAVEGVASSFEVILVNDCSPDTTWPVIVSLCEVDERVKGLNLRRNVGQHNAIIAGLNYASGEVIVVMDDDLQHSPSDIPLLAGVVRSGHDVCFARFKTLHHSWWKRWGSRFNDLVARILLKKPKGIYLSPFKALSREIRDQVILYKGPFTYLDGLILLATSQVTSVDVQHHDRLGSAGNYTLWKSIALWLSMATSFSVLPLRVSSFLGGLMGCSGILLAVSAFVLKISGIYAIPAGWTSLIVVFLLVGGAQLLALGLIGEYLGRTYLSINGAPQYSVKDKANID